MLIGHGELEHGLCKIDGNGSSIHVGLFTFEDLIPTPMKTSAPFDAEKRGESIPSLVADDDGSVIGHVAVSPVTISSGAAVWFGLGPIAVTPAHQGRGIGSQLMEHALTELCASGATGCVVLGDPGYYSRFGSNAEPSLILPSVPPEYFQAIAFSGVLPSGTVSYHDSFAANG